MQPGSFQHDIAEIRRRAREHMERGPVTENYGVDVDTSVRLLNEALASEIVCVLRYRFHWAAAQGITSDSVREQFMEHAHDEEQHMTWIADRINQLGGKPDLNPAGLTSRATTEYVEGENLVEMIREDLVAERIAVQTYRDMIRWFGEKDPTSRIMMERILEQEEDHANDMHDLLVRHEGQPMLDD